MVVAGDAGAEGTDYGPKMESGSDTQEAMLASTETGFPELVTHDPAYVCGVIAYNPYIYATASGSHTNHCLSGQGVTLMEMWGDLQRWNSTDKRWYALDNCYKGPYPGGTTLNC